MLRAASWEDQPLRHLLATSGALAVVLGLAIQSTLNDVLMEEVR